MPSPLPGLLNEVRTLLQAGCRAEARSLLDQILRDDPDNAAAWALLARAEIEPERVAEALWQVVRLRPGDRRAAYYLDRYLAQYFPEDDPLHASPESLPPLRVRRFNPLLIALASTVGLVGLAFALGMLALPAREAVATPRPIHPVTATPARSGFVVDHPTPTATIAQSSPAPATGIPPAASPVPYRVQYGDLQAELAQMVEALPFEVGVAFIDLQTGDQVSINADQRYYALSTFKGALAAYYLWLVERGEIDPRPDDTEHLVAMLNWSSNPDTTCVFKRVGGIAPFNDWLAEEQGMSREYNFVLAWQSWACNEDGVGYLPAYDARYQWGDAALGLPGDRALLRCPDAATPCDKAFRPLDLAMFYRRLYLGEVLSPQDRLQWLAWMEKSPDGSYLAAGIPDESAHVYAKDGYRARDDTLDANFYHEAGIIETEHGAYVLAVFTQRNPAWPGGDTLSDISEVVYRHFTRQHLRAGE